MCCRSSSSTDQEREHFPAVQPKDACTPWTGSIAGLVARHKVAESQMHGQLVHLLVHGFYVHCCVDCQCQPAIAAWWIAAIQLHELEQTSQQMGSTYDALSPHKGAAGHIRPLAPDRLWAHHPFIFFLAGLTFKNLQTILGMKQWHQASRHISQGYRLDHKLKPALSSSTAQDDPAACTWPCSTMHTTPCCLHE